MSAAAPVNSERRDWFRILRDLAGAQVSMARVARVCNRHTTTVQGWAEGSEPRESDARIVLALYARHCPDAYIEHQARYEIRLPAACCREPGDTPARLRRRGPLN